MRGLRLPTMMVEQILKFSSRRRCMVGVRRLA
jgi:hypothetical protein